MDVLAGLDQMILWVMFPIPVTERECVKGRGCVCMHTHMHEPENYGRITYGKALKHKKVKDMLCKKLIRQLI